MGLIEPGAQAAEYHEQEKCGGPDECLIAAGAALGKVHVCLAAVVSGCAAGSMLADGG